MRDMSDVVVTITACRRPYYLGQVLDGWLAARGIAAIRRFQVALGVVPADRFGPMWEVLSEFTRMAPFPVTVLPDDPADPGVWPAIANMGCAAFEDPATGFVIFGEEDALPADDVIELVAWEREQCEANPEVLLVNAHSRCGAGWDGPMLRDNPAADPSAVRLAEYFNPWIWGTWRRQWQDVILPQWDWHGTTGSRGWDNGYDWNLALRVMKGYLAPVPDASRSEHIGEIEGLYATPASLAFARAASFRAHRDPVEFRMVRDGQAIVR